MFLYFKPFFLPNMTSKYYKSMDFELFIPIKVHKAISWTKNNGSFE
jgi:hypothetical protein